jgi:predicted lipoprotein with Yx(FWY)xxD motif
MTTRTFLTVLVAAGVLLTACGSDNTEAYSSATSVPAATTSPSDTTNPTTTGSKAPGDATITIATDPKLGEHLVGADGRTLYLFARDPAGGTACTGGCAGSWPPLVADGTPTAGDGIDATQLATADGIEPNQVTYHGHLLYYFAGDRAAGDANGVGLPDWYTVDPAGEPIQTG